MLTAEKRGDDPVTISRKGKILQDLLQDKEQAGVAYLHSEGFVGMEGLGCGNMHKRTNLYLYVHVNLICKSEGRHEYV